LQGAVLELVSPEKEKEVLSEIDALLAANDSDKMAADRLKASLRTSMRPGIL
jgi:hypothetical protein